MAFVQKFSIQNFADKFIDDETTTMAASLAFYTALSMAPLVIIFVSITSRISPELQYEFLVRAQYLVGDEAAIALKMVMDGAQDRAELSSWAGLLGLATLLISSGLVFGELRFALNKIYHNPHEDTGPLPSFGRLVFLFIRDKLLYVLIALTFIASMTSSLYILSFRLGVHWLTPALSFVFYMVFFAAMFRYIPRPSIPWGRVVHGALVTSLLFVVGKTAIDFYIKRSAMGSAYGAAGSLIVLMLWIYYSSLITLCGAQLSAFLKPEKNPSETGQAHAKTQTV